MANSDELKLACDEALRKYLAAKRAYEDAKAACDALWRVLDAAECKYSNAQIAYIEATSID